MLLDTCESRLTIHLSCTNLRNMDFIGRSDPFALLFLDPTGILPRRRALAASSAATSLPPPLPDPIPPPETRTGRSGAYQGRDPRWNKVGTTETINNSLNVAWATSFEINYFFERAQKLAVDVFDRDVASQSDADIHKHDYLGSAEVSVPALVRAPGQRKTLDLKIPGRPNQKCGQVTIIAENVSHSKQRIHFTPSLSSFSSGWAVNKGKGPYLTVTRPPAGTDTPSSNKITVWRSPAPATPSGPKSFNFAHLTHNYEKFCRCDDTVPLDFQVSYDKGGKHRIVASATASLKELEQSQGRLKLQQIQTGCFPSPSRTPLLHMKDRRMTEDDTFLDYIIGGCDISLVVAIDFTASNGDPSQRGTLHFFDSMEPNEYELAIRAVGDILAAYSSDQLFPAYGFGAKLPPDFHQPCHKFSLTGSPDPTCHTIDDVLNMYRQTLYNVRLSGPTHFAEIIRAAAEHANVEVTQNHQSYSILLIVTDGVISDMQSTLREIKLASMLPLSIVIIGVGDADFSDMVIIDGDDLDQERDIVQFVMFRQYRDTPEVLRSMVLEEIPGQLMQYMKQKGIKPNPPPTD
ncbi:Copine-6 [Gracilariopsis chorda]|uniref:Copine-6 n=1 Tax=Gracilariopsis chorda TaxID=448386 RepID=A0A2V3IVU6_9FLOR|nr:Copine-6 [Gracilariopsis chorda]|eukprot:PXF46241.1 Copine-6 [Gracilariopsis chorda]